MQLFHFLLSSICAVLLHRESLVCLPEWCTHTHSTKPLRICANKLETMKVMLKILFFLISRLYWMRRSEHFASKLNISFVKNTKIIKILSLFTGKFISFIVKQKFVECLLWYSGFVKFKTITVWGWNSVCRICNYKMSTFIMEVEIQRASWPMPKAVTMIAGALFVQLRLFSQFALNLDLVYIQPRI